MGDGFVLYHLYSYCDRSRATESFYRSLLFLLFFAVWTANKSLSIATNASQLHQTWVNFRWLFTSFAYWTRDVSVAPAFLTIKRYMLYLLKKISKERNVLRNKRHPELKYLFTNWIHTVFVTSQDFIC